MMPMRYVGDRMVDSTDNNEYAGSDRDENLWEADIMDADIPQDDDEDLFFYDAGESQRPEYAEEGYKRA